MSDPSAKDSPDTPRQPLPSGDKAAIWSYRGYQLKQSEFVTAMIHFYRGEINRANVWRQRLDTTTNWAVLTTGATLTFAFSSPGGHHGIIILNTFLVTLFLFIESRRYRYYELWSYRIRHMETDFFAAMLVSPFRPSPDWAESLAESLIHPKFSISLWEAFGRRFRRNYISIYLILALAWFAHIGLYPTTAETWSDFFSRAAFGPIPGQLVLLLGIIFNGFIFLIGLFTSTLQAATGEILPRISREEDSIAVEKALHEAEEKIPWYQPHKRRRRQVLALIITDHPKPVSDRILRDMKRGTTALTGTGMFSGAQHAVLMVALTVTEVDALKDIVEEEDPKAFVMITPAKEIFGMGFSKLVHEKIKK